MTYREWCIVGVLFVGFFLISSNIVIVAAILKFLESDLNLSTSVLGVILATFPFVASFSNIIFGPVIDYFGRRRMMIVGSCACIVSFLITASASSATAVILSRGLTAICMPMVGASVIPSIMDHFPKQKQMTIMGYVMAAGALSVVASIPLSIVASGLLSWRIVFIALAILALIFLIGVMFLLPKLDVSTTRKPISLTTYREKYWAFSRSNQTLLNLSVKFLGAFGFMAFAGFYPLWLFNTFAERGADFRDIAVIFLLGGIGGVIGSVNSGKASKRSGNSVKLFAVLAISTGILTVLIPAYTEIFFYQHIMFVAATVTREMQAPIVQTLLMQSVDESQRGSIKGLDNATTQMATALGGILGSYMFLWDDTFVLNGLASGLFLCIAGLIYWFFVKPEV